MPKSKKPGDQRLREPLPSLDDEPEADEPHAEDEGENHAETNRGEDNAPMRHDANAPTRHGDNAPPRQSAKAPDGNDAMTPKRQRANASPRQSANAPKRQDANDSNEAQVEGQPGDAEPSESSRQPSTGDGDDESANPTRLQQQLDFLMEEITMRYEASKLTERTHGRVSKEMEARLSEAVRILEGRYGKSFSKSLLMEYILRIALLDLRENAEESEIVRVLDRVVN